MGVHKFRSTFALCIFLISQFPNVFGKSADCIIENFDNESLGLFNGSCSIPDVTRRFQIKEYTESFQPPSVESKFFIVSTPGTTWNCISNQDAIKVETGTQIMIKHYISKMSEHTQFYLVIIYDANDNTEISKYFGSWSEPRTWTNYTYTMEKDADIKIDFAVLGVNDANFVAVDFISILSEDCDLRASDSEPWEAWLIVVVTLACVAAVCIIGGIVFYFCNKNRSSGMPQNNVATF